MVVRPPIPRVCLQFPCYVFKNGVHTSILLFNCSTNYSQNEIIHQAYKQELNDIVNNGENNVSTIIHIVYSELIE